MKESTKAIIRTIILEDESLTTHERETLLHFLKHGTIRFDDISEKSMLLTANGAAEALGMSTDTFKGIRDQAALIGLKELCGVEVTPHTVMFSRVHLARYSLGEYDLCWRGKPPSPKSTSSHLVEASWVVPFTLEAVH